MPGGPDEWLATVRGCQYLPETDLKRLCEMVKELLMEESNIQPREAEEIQIGQEKPKPPERALSGPV